MTQVLIAGELSAATDGETVCNVPLGTCKVLVSTTVEQTLRIVVPVGVLVEEVVVAEVQTDIVGDVPHRTGSELGRRVLVDLLAIAELVDGIDLTGLIDG